jgi:DNA repair photolyase
MYFPYFRGKQFELILLRDNSKLIAQSQISPIIEPVRSNFSPLIRAVTSLNNAGAKSTVIVNPQVGQSQVNTETILSELIDSEFKDYSNISIGYILDTNSHQKDLMKLLKQYPDKPFTLIHNGFTKGKELSLEISKYPNVKIHAFIDNQSGKLYQKHFNNGNSSRVLIKDGFKQQKKNSDYPPSEHFSDLHITYEEEEMDGFGDFLIVGDEYSDTGGPAYAVAIHLTYLDDEKNMFIYHFLSNQNDSPIDPGGKFLEALAKLIRELTKPNSSIFMSEACKEYQSLFAKQHFPGLGHVKKLSMQHHVELIAKFLNNE